MKKYSVCIEMCRPSSVRQSAVRKCKTALLQIAAVFFTCVLFFSCQTARGAALRQAALENYPPEKPFSDSQFMMVDGVRLHVRQWKAVVKNDGENPIPSKGLVLLVSGVSGSTHNWRYAAPALAESGWDVLTCDIPPFGFSGEKQKTGYALDPLPEDSAARADLLWNFVDTVYPAYRGRLIIAGHSLGGRIASIMTISKSERVEKLILIAPAVYGRSVIPTAAKYWPVKQIAVPAAKKLLNDINVIRFVANTAYGSALTDEQLTASWAPLLREGAAEACAVWADKSVDSQAPQMELISVPTLILWAEHDAIVPNKGKRLEKEMSNARYIEIPCSSHAVMDTHYEAVVHHMCEFVNAFSADGNPDSKNITARYNAE